MTPLKLKSPLVISELLGQIFVIGLTVFLLGSIALEIITGSPLTEIF